MATKKTTEAKASEEKTLKVQRPVFRGKGGAKSLPEELIPITHEELLKWAAATGDIEGYEAIASDTGLNPYPETRKDLLLMYQAYNIRQIWDAIVELQDAINEL